jgi:lactate permease
MTAAPLCCHWPEGRIIAVLPLLAALPLVCTIVLMAGFNWPARRTLPLAWLGTALIAATAWQVDLHALAAYSLYGALKALDILLVLYGALVVLQLLRASGAMDAIAHAFDGLTRDARLQAILVGWLFGGFIEGMAGYGTPAALAAPLLVGLGFPPLAAVATALLYNCTPVSFAAGGVPIAAAVETLSGLVPAEAADAFAYDLGLRVALIHSILGCFLPLAGIALLTRAFGAERSFRPALACAPFALFAGAAFCGPYLLAAWWLGPEFPSIVGSILGMLLVVAAVRTGFLVPKNPWTFPDAVQWPAAWLGGAPAAVAARTATPMPLLRAALPYALIAGLLVLTRVPALGVQPWLRDCVLTWEDLLGVPGLTWRFAWAYNPGVLPFLLVALLIAPLHGLTRGALAAGFLGGAKQVWGAGLALTGGVAMVQVMLHSGDGDLPGMTAVLAQSAAAITGSAYGVISPVVGLLGAFMSGSNTVSNILFATFQYSTAVLLGLSPLWTLAAQVVGGAAGSMAGFNTVVAACTATGMRAAEGAVMRRNALPALVYALLAGLLALAGAALAK